MGTLNKRLQIASSLAQLQKGTATITTATAYSNSDDGVVRVVYEGEDADIYVSSGGQSGYADLPTIAPINASAQNPVSVNVLIQNGEAIVIGEAGWGDAIQSTAEDALAKTAYVENVPSETSTLEAGVHVHEQSDSVYDEPNQNEVVINPSGILINVEDESAGATDNLTVATFGAGGISLLDGVIQPASQWAGDPNDHGISMLSHEYFGTELNAHSGIVEYTDVTANPKTAAAILSADVDDEIYPGALAQIECFASIDTTVPEWNPSRYQGYVYIISRGNQGPLKDWITNSNIHGRTWASGWVDRPYAFCSLSANDTTSGTAGNVIAVSNMQIASKAGDFVLYISSGSLKGILMPYPGFVKITGHIQYSGFGTSRQNGVYITHALSSAKSWSNSKQIIGDWSYGESDVEATTFLAVRTGDVIYLNSRCSVASAPIYATNNWGYPTAYLYIEYLEHTEE